MRLRSAAPHEGYPDAIPPSLEGGKGSAGMCSVSCVPVLEVGEARPPEARPGHSVGLEGTILHHGIHVQTSGSHESGDDKLDGGQEREASVTGDERSVCGIWQEKRGGGS